MVIDRTMINADTIALRVVADFMPLNIGSFFKARNKAEDGSDTGRDQAQEQAYAVDNGQCADAHCIAGRERWNGRAAVDGVVNALPAHEHEYRQGQCDGVHDKGYPHRL